MVNNLALSQNLIPNPSFEELYACPIASGYEELFNWYSPGNGSPDVFSTCVFQPRNGVPYNFAGIQYPRTDSTYLGLAVLYQSPFREYIGVKLSAPLEKDSSYCISMYVSVADRATVFSDGLGWYIGDSIEQNLTNQIITSPSAGNKSGNIIDNKTNWVLIEDYYVAKGGEEYVTIGNFLDISDCNYYGDFHNGSNGTYMYIDDVSMYKCQPPHIDSTINDTIITETSVSLYPNPSNGNAYFDYDIEHEQNGLLNIYDSRGRLVYKSEPLNGSGKLHLDLYQLATGLYVWKFDVNNTHIKTEKLIITR